MTKLDLLKKLRAEQLKQDAWTSALPRDLSTAFYNNEFVDSLFMVQDLLLKAVMGDCYEDCVWFLNEYRPADDGHVQIKEVDGTEWSFPDDESYYSYFRKVCGE